MADSVLDWIPNVIMVVFRVPVLYISVLPRMLPLSSRVWFSSGPFLYSMQVYRMA